MPTYTYACTDCDEQLEVVQSFTSDPLTECPRCGGRLRKVFHPVGVVFKGSGFYRTDSRTTSTGGTAKPSKESAGTEASSGSGSGGGSASDGSGSSASPSAPAAATTSGTSGGSSSGSGSSGTSSVG